ncbi:metalloregulator ArsR/SmtB family transcription factor [Pseudarthrobacter sp. H3Y2-7]|uniref:ArsR/SmtB family transcription factor n=1 Tax=Pseudarthrobacter naphthalenicus TaxID=3031328 RepID=UPI0023B1F891|nr:metalloregulator ArsR/SmtB family transcription factor [Pseudarthrobacter sp. H3Y2-7]MDE8669985.1 metalloregulator ArsR/SmtB family transcription factor [Pseudarthrobacter sp. H3Y2-7]
MTAIPLPASSPTFGSGSDCAVRLVDADRVEAVRARMPQGSEVSDLAVIFGLLSDPGRVRILIALLEGEMCVCDLAATTGLSESGVSHALRLLRGPRVVEVRRSGRMAYYSLADAHVRMLLDLGLTHVGHAGQDRLQLARKA